MDRTTIKIKNGGIVIPIAIHEEEQVYIPELIFSDVLTSSNYVGERTAAGTNGYGAKLTNIYSKSFKIEVGDAQRKLLYVQEWNNNMTVGGAPFITNYSGENYVCVTYQLDFERFDYTEYPDEAFIIFAQHAANAAFTYRVPVIFNNIKLNFKIKQFVKLCYGSDIKMLVHYEWPAGTRLIKKGNVYKPENSETIPIVEIALVDSPNQGDILAFTNGIINAEGGQHIDAALKAIEGPILNKIKSVMGAKHKKGKKDDKNKGPTINLADLRQNVTVVISVWVMNPSFKGQFKVRLNSPKPRIDIAPEKLGSIASWLLIRRLIAAWEIKQMRMLMKTDGKRRGRIHNDKVTDANRAGKQDSEYCILVLTEGDSAQTYAENLFAHIDGFRDWYGFFPLRGKPLNVTEISDIRVAGNREITTIKESLGLAEGIDYKVPDNYAMLRYGKVCIIADPDPDGKHITALLLNFFKERFPSIMELGMIIEVKVPILWVTIKGQDYKFFTRVEYNDWLLQNPGAPFPKYFKGLGSFNAEATTKNFHDLYTSQFIKDVNADKQLDLAFNPKRAADRKDWIDEDHTDPRRGRLTQANVSDFINYELIEHTMLSLLRAIPGFMDGLKMSQRQILYSVFKRWGAKIYSGGQPQQVKVSILGAYAAETTNYHHGDTSINATIIGMAQTYPTSNNLPHLHPEGQFGSRSKNGKDAPHPRYIHTFPEWWLRFVYKKEDQALLVHREEEGEKWEPLFFLPIIPICLLNGLQGIATGFSTYMPPHHPLDLCQWLLCRLSNIQLPDIIPWFRGFKGTVKVAPTINIDKQPPKMEDVFDMGPSIEEENTVEPEEENDMGADDVNFDLGTNRVAVKDGLSLYTTGVREINGTTVTVTEIPIGRSIHAYKNWLKELLEKKCISGLELHHKPDEAKFILKGVKDASYRGLRLRRSFGLNNMLLLDADGKPRYYATTKDILETFYHQRSYYYVKRKEHIIKTNKEKIEHLQLQIRLVRAIDSGQLVLKDLKDAFLPWHF